MDLSNHKIVQIGYVYNDIEKQANLMETILGIPKFTFMPAVDHTAQYRGKETRYISKMGFSRYLNVQLELIELIEGECIYGEFLKEGRQGFHHIAVIVEGIQLFIDEFKELNINLIQSSGVGKMRVYYFDTEGILGTLLELQVIVKRRKKK